VASAPLFARRHAVLLRAGAGGVQGGRGARREGEREAMIRFDGKVVLVTGGTAGLGLATARLVRTLGAQVAIAGRDAARGAAAAAALGPDVLFVAADVARDDDVRRLMEEVRARFRRLDVLVNSAGILRRLAVDEEDAAGWDEVMAVNLRGTFLCCKHALPLLRAQGGAIVNIASVLAFRAQQGRSPGYDASKAGVVALTRALAVRYGPAGVRANAVCPGFVETELNRDVWGTWTPAQRQAFVELYPLRRLGTPEDVAAAVVFLASDAAAWITGATLVVDGGRSAS
jgi:NAD(P)-dependent dehydrogenase (short-subunit alcohol dehydrogenase family)